VSVAFGEHSNITNLRKGTFGECFALKSITLPNKLTIIEEMAFANCSALERLVFNKSLKTICEYAFQNCCALKSIICLISSQYRKDGCTSLKRVVFNKNLKTIGSSTFQGCSKLEEVQLASRSISFDRDQFVRCDLLIEIANAAGFPSNTFNHKTGSNWGIGVAPYLIAGFERLERKRFVLLALLRFKIAVHAHDGDEKEKVAAAKQHHPRPPSMPHPT